MTKVWGASFLLVAFVCAAEPFSRAWQSDVALETTGTLRETIHANRDWGKRNTAPDGAYSRVNIAWDQTLTGDWFIEQQRDAEDMVAIGLAFHDEEAVERGLRVIEWSFRQQAPDGSFESNDAFAALGEAAVVLNDSRLKQRSAEYIRDGLALQRPDGVYPEKEGFDTNYQAVGLSFALRYFRLVADAELQAEMRPHLQHGVEWLASRIGPDGTVSTEGNTRSNGQENNRNGTSKGVNYTWAVRTFAGSASISRDSQFDALAHTVWQRWQVVKPS